VRDSKATDEDRMSVLPGSKTWAIMSLRPNREKKRRISGMTESGTCYIHDWNGTTFHKTQAKALMSGEGFGLCGRKKNGVIVMLRNTEQSRNDKGEAHDRVCACWSTSQSAQLPRKCNRKHPMAEPSAISKDHRQSAHGRLCRSPQNPFHARSCHS